MSKLIGHRGYPKRYPENTILSLQQALLAGADGVEFDIQFSKDHVPILCHDINLSRVFGIDKDIFELDASELYQLQSQYPADYAAKNRGEPLSNLQDFASSFADNTQSVFIEIKAESYARLGKTAIDKIMAASRSIQNRYLISFEISALAQARAAGAKIGLIVDEAIGSFHDANLRTLINSLKPEIICAELKFFADGKPDFAGAFMCYSANNQVDLERMQSHGIDFIETDCIGDFK